MVTMVLTRCLWTIKSFQFLYSDYTLLSRSQLKRAAKTKNCFQASKFKSRLKWQYSPVQLKRSPKSLLSNLGNSLATLRLRSRRFNTMMQYSVVISTTLPRANSRHLSAWSGNVIKELLYSLVRHAVRSQLSQSVNQQPR